ncbi:MAG: HAMP domain-containing sensor histidine kinase [Phycisphaerales bacterium]
MKRSRRVVWWSVYAGASVAVTAALGWATARVLHLQREEAQARAQVQRQETLRQALWQMDSWLAPRLARESARTWFEFDAYYPQTMAYNRLLQPLSEGTVVLPSPLLTFQSDFLPLHFQYRDGTGFTSPQVPSAVYNTSVMEGCSPMPADPRRAGSLASFAKQTDPAALRARIEAGEAQLARALGEEQPAPGMLAAAAGAAAPAGGSVPEPVAAQPPSRRTVRSFDDAATDLKNRQSSSNAAQQLVMKESQTEQQWAQRAGGTSAPVQVGALVPLWLGDPPNRLVLARRVRTDKESILQGVLVDWPVLRTQLLAQIQNLLPGAQLAPAPATGDPDPSVSLAGLPVVLVPPPMDIAAAAEGTDAGLAGLGLAWIAALGALATTGLALRASIASETQTSRFASSVTHELRTPLTTFRLYAEMLADGMVPPGEQHRAYLETLRDESARLGFLVENVLTWSRVEEGRATVELRPIAAAELLAAAEPVLRRRCQEAGARLELRIESPEARVQADPDRVRQILFNLVDNACKYAGQGATVRVGAQERGSSLVLAVDDDGAGIPAKLRDRIFRAFDRGDRGPGDAVRGLGLGLAISRELARGLRGALRCGTSDLGGARFELELPLTASGDA